MFDGDGKKVKKTAEFLSRCVVVTVYTEKKEEKGISLTFALFISTKGKSRRGERNSSGNNTIKKQHCSNTSTASCWETFLSKKKEHNSSGFASFSNVLSALETHFAAEVNPASFLAFLCCEKSFISGPRRSFETSVHTSCLSFKQFGFIKFQAEDLISFLFDGEKLCWLSLMKSRSSRLTTFYFCSTVKAIAGGKLFFLLRRYPLLHSRLSLFTIFIRQERLNPICSYSVCRSRPNKEDNFSV